MTTKTAVLRIKQGYLLYNEYKALSVLTGNTGIEEVFTSLLLVEISLIISIQKFIEYIVEFLEILSRTK